MGWRDRQDSAVRQSEPGAAYPWIQWVNKGADLDPRRQAGGFFITSENLATLGDPEIALAESSSWVFNSGDTETGVFLPSITVAVMARRFCWQTWDGQRKVYHETFVPNARGKLQTLVLLATQSDPMWIGPVMLTLTGTITNDLSEAIKAHRDVVRKATAGKGATPWFWMTLERGEVERRGSGSQTSPMTPLHYVQAEPFDPDQFYVGDDVADWMEARWETITAWAEEWEGGVAGDDDVEPSEPEQGPAPTGNPAPFQHGTGSYNSLGEARKAFSNQWNRLKGLGVTAPMIELDWNPNQVGKAAQLLKAAADGIEQKSKGRDIAAAELIAGFEHV